MRFKRLYIGWCVAVVFLSQAACSDRTTPGHVQHDSLRGVVRPPAGDTRAVKTLPLPPDSNVINPDTAGTSR